MSEVKLIKTSTAKPGMILASDIANEFGAVIIYKNSKLDKESINKLLEMGFEIIKVYTSYSTKENKAKVVEATYNNNLVQVNDLFGSIRTGKNINMEKITQISENIKDNFSTTSDVISCLAKIRTVHEYTYCHSLNVSMLCSLLGQWLNLDDEQIKQLSYCGLLHDIGKAKISPEILNKPDKLTQKEFEEIKKHPVIGYEILKNDPTISSDIALGVLMHHEREDGSGYPLGIKSDKISLFAKILAIADTYDAMTSERTFQKRLPPLNVLEIYKSELLVKCDPSIGMTFFKNIVEYYIGSNVKLSNGDSGQIVFINTNYISKPLVRLKDGSIIDLYKNSDIKILEMY